MSRAQSPSREQALTMNLFADKLVQLTKVVSDLKEQMGELKPNVGGNHQATIVEQFESTSEPMPIKTYDKAMHLIPEFDGTNVESFISHIQMAIKRISSDQLDLLLCSIIAQKLTRRTRGSVRVDVTPNFPSFFEKLRFLFGKSKNLSALEVQRDTCIQRPNESVDEFINRFLQIHDEIITTINSQDIGTTTICIQEDIYQQKAIEVFRRNVKSEIGDHLYAFDLNTLNLAFSKARAFEGELQLRRLRIQRNGNFMRRPSFQPTRTQPKECTYCRRRGHEERECRTKIFHQRSQNFRERQDVRKPPDHDISRRLHAVDLGLNEEPHGTSIKDQEGLMSVLRE